MSLMKWDPFRDIDNVRNDMNGFFSGWPFKYFYDREFRQPRVDVYETEKNIKVTAEMPGLESKNDVEIYVTDDSVQLKGEYKRSDEHKADNVFHNERFFGSFMRTISLPNEVKPDQAKATYNNGVLNITIPKSETSSIKGKRIDIN